MTATHNRSSCQVNFVHHAQSGQRVSKAMDTIWSNKLLERCNECYKKIGDVFYDAKIFACEGFR